MPRRLLLIIGRFRQGWRAAPTSSIFTWSHLGWRTADFSDSNSRMSTATLAGAPHPIDRWKDRAFYTGMSVAVIASVYRGFARSYFLRGQYFSTPLAPIAKLHGAVFLSWTVLLLVQTALVARRRTDIHRRLGVAGAILAGAMVVVGTAIAIISMRHNFASGNQGALSFFAIPVGDMLVFPILVAAALAWRRQAETHKRLMLLATVSVLDAAVARWPLAIMAHGPVAFFAAVSYTHLDVYKRQIMRSPRCGIRSMKRCSGTP